MGSIVDQQVIVAVELQHVEAEHKALQHRVRLEGDDAVQIPLILRPEHCSIDLPVKLLQEVVLAQRLHVVCKEEKTCLTLLITFILVSRNAYFIQF